MKVRTKKVLLSAIGVAGLGLWNSAEAATFTWSGSSASSNLVTDGSNWLGGVAPTLVTANASNDWLFTATTAQTTVSTPYAGSAGPGGQVNSFNFAAGAPAYIISQANPLAMEGVNDLSFTSVFNNSSNLQTIDTALNSGNATMASTGAAITFGQNSQGTSYLYATSPITFDITHDININVPELQSGTRNIYGPNGTSTTPANMVGVTGVFNLNVNSGTGSAGGSNFTGQIGLWSDFVHITANDALAAGSNGRLYIHGTFPTAASGTTGQSNVNTGGFEHGFGALELSNNVTIQQRMRIDSRIGDLADVDDIINLSDNNTIGLSTNPTGTGWNQIGGGGHFNVDTLAGSLTIWNIPNVSDPGHSGGAVVNNIFTFRGAGNTTVGGPIVFSGTAGVNPGAFGAVTVRKQGSGIFTMSGQSSTYDGGTMVDGGTFLVSSTGSFTSGKGRIHVASGAALDVSAVTSGLTLGSTQPLSGLGTVYGSVTSNGSTISPGGTDSLDATDTLTYTPGVGALHLNNNFTSNDTSTMQFDLSNSTSSGNDAITVGGNLSLTGTTNVLVNPVNGTLATGTYTLINYTGSLTGGASNLSLTVPGRGINAHFDTSTANQLNLVISSYSPFQNLTWAGGQNSNAFDVLTTVNWTGATDGDNRFYNGDNVTFADGGSTSPSINVTGTPTPSTVTFSNSTGHDYSLAGAGSINDLGDFTVTGSGNVTIGNASLNVGGAIKQNGTGTLTFTSTPVAATGGIVINSGNVSINNGASDTTFSLTVSGTGTLRKDGTGVATLTSNNSAFDGPIVVANGTLRITSGNALGTAVGSTTVNNGATLDLFGSNVGTEVVQIQGNGAAGQRGALVDTSGQGNKVLSHINQLILAGDSTICAQNNQLNGSFIFVDGNNASLQGNGFNLNLLLDSNCESDWFTGATNLNNINVTGGGGNAGAGGVLYIGGNTDLGSTGVLTLSNGGKLGLYGSSVVNTKPIEISTSGNGVAGIEYDVVDTNVGSVNATTLGSPINADGNLDLFNYKPVTSRPLTFSGAITGNGAIGFHGNNAVNAVFNLTSDSNSWTGAAVIGGGGGLNNITSTNDQVTVSIGNGGTTGSIGSGPLDVEGTLQFNKGAAYTVSTPISGNGTMSFVNSAGAVKITGVNDNFFGPTVMKGGSAEFAVASQLPILQQFGDGVDIQLGRIILDYTPGNSPAGMVNDYLKQSYPTSVTGHPNFQAGQFRDSTDTATTALGEYDNGTVDIVGETAYGDANLDGIVNALDFNALATNYGNTSNPRWYQGDFNYDGSVDSNDFDLIAMNFGTTVPTGSEPVDDAAPAASLGSLVPEPTSLGLLGIAGIMAMRRRARR